MAKPATHRFDRIKVPAAYQMVAEAIEAQILSGRLKLGDEIGTEAELVQQFGVNRSTVREGIRVLEQGGLVCREAGRKLFVCEPRYNALSSRMSRAMILREVTFRELFDTAFVLEVGAVEAAVTNATGADIEALRANHVQLSAAVHDPVILSKLDTQFHALVARASKNRVLELAREPAAHLFFPTTEMICRRVPEGPKRMVEAHGRIIDAIEARDPEGAVAWMRRHVVDWRKGFVRAGRDVNEPVERVYAHSALGGLPL
jgi:DNA-binding FadR family transcriptional regulator